MMTTSLPFEFEGVADPQGHVNISRTIPIGPLRIRITSFTLRTHSGCRDRQHDLKVHINGNSVFNGDMHDCLNLSLRSDRNWRGMLTIHFNATGFDPGETVHGKGDVEFVFALL